MVIMVLNKIKATCLKGGGEVIIQQVEWYSICTNISIMLLWLVTVLLLKSM